MSLVSRLVGAMLTPRMKGPASGCYWRYIVTWSLVDGISISISVSTSRRVGWKFQIISSNPQVGPLLEPVAVSHH
jgi:hypothetical protein